MTDRQEDREESAPAEQDVSLLTEELNFPPKTFSWKGNVEESVYV